MKRILGLLMVALAMTSCSYDKGKGNGSQITSVRHARAFDRLEIRGLCDVKFIQGDTFAIKVTGREDMVGRVSATFDGSTLKVGLDDKKRWFNFMGNWPAPTVYVTSPDLVYVSMSGVGDFEIEGPLDTDTLEVHVKGVGDLDMQDVVCDVFKSSLVGTGDVVLRKLTAQHSDISLKGTGDVSIHFEQSGTADCRLTGVGDIKLCGTLKQLQKSVRGTGDIDTSELQVARSKDMK